MSSYCETFRPLNSKYPITTVTIPPDQVRRMELRTVQLIIQCGGKPMGVGLGQEDGSLVFQATFFDDASCKKFCDTIDKEIDAGRPVTITPVRRENGEEEFEVKFNIKFMLAKFHSIMGEIQPLLTFVEENGGWPTDNETFSGGDALDNGIRDETLPPEVMKAINTFGTFMGSYFIGSASISSAPTIVHRDLTP